jgi:O-antigen/teichoic acid export membrane protein
MRRSRTVLNDGAWVAAGQVVTALLTLGGTRLVTQFVEPGLFGTVNLLQNIEVLLRGIFCTPLLNASLRYYPESAQTGSVGALRRLLVRWMRLAVAAISALVLTGGALWCVSQRKSFWIPVALMALAVVDVARTTEVTLLGAARRQPAVAAISVAEALGRPLLIVAIVLVFGASAASVLAATAASVLVPLVLFYRTTQAEGHGVAPSASQTMSRDLRQFALPLVPIAVLNWTTAVSDRYLIQLFTRDAFSVGLYAAAYGLVSQPFLMAHGVVALTLRPVYFSAVARGDAQHAARIFSHWLALTASIALGGVVLSFALREWAVRMFLAKQYAQAASVVPWIAVGYLFLVLQQVFEQRLLARNRTRAVLVAQCFGATASVIITVPLVLQFGMMGAAYACPVYFAIQCLVTFLLVRRPFRT